jgi:hypothetical protein
MDPRAAGIQRKAKRQHAGYGGAEIAAAANTPVRSARISARSILEEDEA